jgi:hypothetical protein
MAAIMAATMLGLVYLTQTLGANATNSAIYRLEVQLTDLKKVVTRQEADVLNATEADAVIARLKPLKLGRLGPPTVLRAP